MKYNPEIHRRRSIHLQGYDHSRAGAYFVTVCTQNRECRLGNIVDGKMMVNDAEWIACEAWEWLATQYNHVELNQWVIMPNHIHGIIVISTLVTWVIWVGAVREPPLPSDMIFGVTYEEAV